MVGPAVPVLQRFNSALKRLYGHRLERAVLFGSRARGNANLDSDYDIAVFLNGLYNFGEEAERIASIETEILYETGAIINAMPFRAGSYRDRTGLMAEVRRDGFVL